MKNLAAVLLWVGIAGCGDNNAAQDLAVAGDLAISMDLSSSVDMKASPDLAYTPSTDGGPFMCGGAVCTGTQVCCATGPTTASCQTSCGDGGLKVQCSGPEFCGGNPCCLTVQGLMPKDISCTTSKSQCVPAFDQSGNGMTRLCHGDADCVGGGTYTDCCTASGGGGSQRFCFSKGLVSFTGGQVTCP